MPQKADPPPQLQTTARNSFNSEPNQILDPGRLEIAISLTALTCCLIISLTACLVPIPFHYSGDGTIETIPPPAAVIAPSAGTITALPVTNGSRVRAGDILAIIEQNTSTPQGSREATELAMIRVRLQALRDKIEAERKTFEAQKRAISAEKDSHISKLANGNKILQATQKRLSAAQEITERYRKLYKTGFASRGLLLEHEQKLADAELEWSRSQMEIDKIKAELEAMSSKRSILEQEISSSMATFLAEEAALREAEAAVYSRKEVHVLAPAAGYVENLAANNGDSIITGHPLAKIVPNSKDFVVKGSVPAHIAAALIQGAKATIFIPTEKGLMRDMKLPGRLERVAMTSSASTTNTPSYSALIRIDRSALISRSQEILDSMPVKYSIETVRRPLIRFVAPVGP